MPSLLPFRKWAKPSLHWVLLCALMTVLLLAGGASRADVPGQVIVRATACAVTVVAILFGDPALHRLSLGHAQPLLILLALAIALAALQLVPLPPSWWQALPGRGVLTMAATASGEAQPWRPLSMVPDATLNALGSLVVPLAVLMLALALRTEERARLPGLMLCLVTASALIGLLQISIPGFSNTLVGDDPGFLSGSFANRNHFSLFLALGCLLVSAWVFPGGRRPHWRAPVGFALLVLFVLLILAAGSRAGLILGALALIIGLGVVWRSLHHELARYPRWVFPALVMGMVGVIGGFVLVSVVADRAASISRALATDTSQDMRTRGLPTVLAMVRLYFPVGSGFGGFDPVFRVHEPFTLLRPTYFNHAHDDLIEIVLDGGLPALLLLGGALTWWGVASLRAWRADAKTRDVLPKLGSAMLLLILIASAFDYPARTPIMMATIGLAAFWLAGDHAPRRSPPLPVDD